ncbi:MAG: hypothetical protein EHM61_22210 [Acidobacteria bacterium]|nr:MAG: hypothetical protein EHM61_22210 [Acidobacteriota bacterium]
MNPNRAVGGAGPFGVRRQSERPAPTARLAPGPSSLSKAGLLFCLMLPAFLSPLFAQSTHALIVVSASGEEQFKEQFWDWGSRLHRVLTEQMQVPRNQVVFLFEDPSKDPSLVTGKSTKSEMTSATERVANDCKEGDVLLVMLLGHGSHDGRNYKFNLVGPDVTDGDLEQLLRPFSKQEVVLVAATPSSGDLTRTLAGKNRVIIAATKSGLENNQTVFGGFFVEAFENQAADTDKNGRVSILEAYLYTQKKVDGFYKERQKLATEHSLLEDDGNGRGSSIPSPKTGDGILATRLSLNPAGDGLAASNGPGDNQQLRNLHAAKRKVESDIETLKYKKATMEEAEYQKDLERLLLDLARTDRQIRSLEKGK